MRVVNFEIVAGSDGDAGGEHHDIDAARMFGRGVFNPGDPPGILGELTQQLCGRMRLRGPGAGHLLGSCAERGQGIRIGQIQQALEDTIYADDDRRRRTNRHRAAG